VLPKKVAERLGITESSEMTISVTDAGMQLLPIDR